jgi:ADP-ribose pyrophosphatase YjhB (NUDIX family)
MTHIRSGILLIEDEKVALIRRVNARGTYYLFPGGTVEAGESPEEAAVREAREELGLEVRLSGLAAVVEYGDTEQRFYLAQRIGGVFGMGEGEELVSPAGSARGTYTPVWVKRSCLNGCNVCPPELARLIAMDALVVGGATLRIREESS